MNIAEELLKRVDYSELEGLHEVEFDTKDTIYHMDYDCRGKVECSLTILKYNESDDDYVEVEDKETCQMVEEIFKSEIEDVIGRNGLDPAFRDWEEVNRMCY